MRAFGSRGLNPGVYRAFCATETTLPAAVAPGTQTAAASPRGSRWLLGGGALLAAWVVLWDRLRIDWSVNDQYAYGWFMPPLAIALFALRWRDQPPPQPPTGAAKWMPALAAGVGLALLLPVRLIEEPNGDWRLIEWTHALVLAGVTLAALGWCGGRRWAWHFAFPVGFLLLALRWPSGLEHALIQGLQQHVAALTAGGMTLLGIPAEQVGNLIRVRDQTVGVNEACSGIRSLQTVLMASLFLGELSRMSSLRRVALLAGGVAVALAANVFRSSLLVWIAAQHGTAALEKFHDTAGVSVLVIVFIGLLILNGWLEHPVAGKPARMVEKRADGARTAPAWSAVAVLVWLLAVEAGTAGWYGMHERGRVLRPSWTVALPTDAPGFKALPVDDVSRGLLRYDEGVSARWRTADPDGTGPGDDCTLFFFRWEPGRTSATLAAMHQPTTCLPASGLTQTADGGVLSMPGPGGVTLPVHAYEFLLKRQHLFVYYVVWQDQTGYDLPDAGRGLSVRERLDAVRRGQRNLGQQTLELVLTGPATAAQAAAVARGQIERVTRAKG